MDVSDLSEVESETLAWIKSLSSCAAEANRRQRAGQCQRREPWRVATLKHACNPSSEAAATGTRPLIPCQLLPSFVQRRAVVLFSGRASCADTASFGGREARSEQVAVAQRWWREPHAAERSRQVQQRSVAVSNAGDSSRVLLHVRVRPHPLAAVKHRDAAGSRYPTQSQSWLFRGLPSACCVTSTGQQGCVCVQRADRSLQCGALQRLSRADA